MIKLSPSQLLVVEEFPEFLSNDDPEMTISGFAGSGKSFLVEYLAEAVDKQQKLLKVIDPTMHKLNIFFTATTNKAAAVLAEMLQDSNVSTIHKLMGLVVQNDYKTGKQILVEKSRITNLNNSILFIDESSMINLELLEMIHKAQQKFANCKIVFIGDAYQLPPVLETVCPVFNKNAQNVFFLNEIQRQVADNPIIQLSAQYRAVLDDHTKNWPEIPEDGKHIFHYTKKHDFFDKIKAAYIQEHRINQYKIVAWSNNRVRSYNRWIRKLQGMTAPFQIGETMVSNKPLFHKGLIMAPTDTLHKIVGLKEHTIDAVSGYKIKLLGFGDIEFFQPISWPEASALAKHYAKEAKLTRDWKPYFKVTQEWADLRPVHASTVHKAQGSTYDEVFVDLNNIGTNTRWQEVARLVYVAITRASDKVHIFGNLCMNYNKQPSQDFMEAFTDVNDI